VAATSYKSSIGYTEANGILTASPQNLYIPSADAGFPDGTQAKRMQVSGALCSERLDRHDFRRAEE